MRSAWLGGIWAIWPGSRMAWRSQLVDSCSARRIFLLLTTFWSARGSCRRAGSGQRCATCAQLCRRMLGRRRCRSPQAIPWTAWPGGTMRPTARTTASIKRPWRPPLDSIPVYRIRGNLLVPCNEPQHLGTHNGHVVQGAKRRTDQLGGRNTAPWAPVRLGGRRRSGHTISGLPVGLGERNGGWRGSTWLGWRRAGTASEGRR